MNNMRENFCVLKCSNTVRKVIKNYVRCKRLDSRPKFIAEAHLAVDKIKEVVEFEVIRIEYACPLFLREGQKVWIVIFICAVYRSLL